ncbi:amidohydrolase family protein [Roseivirga sp. BDSF3-8]|uniref:amidohydrolase family protein n=1 Tax=Roseivirga sp. BDSF3-8 TaxID=3241598 RepID=UPI00353185C1
MKKVILTTLGVVCYMVIACPDAGAVHLKADTTAFNIYFGDRQAGKQLTVNYPENTYTTTYEFNDRGRGPYLEEQIILNEQGIPRSFIAVGHDYMKDTVSETFTLYGQRAQWKSEAEAGSLTLEGETALYSPGQSSFVPMEILVKYLLRDEGNSVRLLPGGEARILDVQPHTFGDTLTLKLVSLSGFSFAPYQLWVDQDNNMVAYLYTTWFALIREGYHTLRSDMLDLQTTKEDIYYEELATRLTELPDNGFAITNVKLYDPVSMSIQENMTVAVENNRISMVAPTSGATLPKDLKIIDGSGKTLLPGLFDMHTHISKSDGILHLAAGVTSVRDMGNTLQLPELSKQFNENELLGPRLVVMAGFIDKEGPYTGPTGKSIASLEEGLEAIEYYHNNGYKQIKLYSSIEPEWVKPLAEKAHSLDMRLSGHIPSFMTAEEAVRDGYDEIQHANMVLLNFMPDTIDTRTPLRFTHVGAHGHEVETESKTFAEFTDLLKENSVALDPTVSVFEGMFKGRKGRANPAFAMIVDRLPVQTRRSYYQSGLPIPEEEREYFSESFQRMLDIVKTLHDNGVTIIPGTDAMAGFALHRELENYVKAGLSPREVLRTATLTSAEVTGMDDSLGSLETGKLADMILVDGNPAEDISKIRNVVLTIKDGRLYDPKKLYEAIGVE